MFRTFIPLYAKAPEAPGRHTGTLTVRSNSSKVGFPITLEVLAAILPPPDQWAFHLDLWQHPDAVARWTKRSPISPGVAVPSPESMTATSTG